MRFGLLMVLMLIGLPFTGCADIDYKVDNHGPNQTQTPQDVTDTSTIISESAHEEDVNKLEKDIEEVEDLLNDLNELENIDFNI